VLFYIGIAAGAVTHKDLLLANAVKLPFLGVELPLVAFFFLAPILFIVRLWPDIAPPRTLVFCTANID
jgi:hypothetical protein